MSEVPTGQWHELGLDTFETGEIDIRPLTTDEARKEHTEFLHELAGALRANDMTTAKDVVFRITVLEQEFPELAPDTDHVTHHDS